MPRNCEPVELTQIQSFQGRTQRGEDLRRDGGDGFVRDVDTDIGGHNDAIPANDQAASHAPDLVYLV
jgi:hypothetical protein